MNQPKIKFTLLGTGTSSGVPTISCKCDTCVSNDIRDKRLRCSVMIETDTTRVIIDSSADFRQQMLKYNVDKLDAVVYTHHHFDHISGFDDIRAFNFTSKKQMPIYLNSKTLESIKSIFSYAFGKAEQIGGGIPKIDVNIIEEDNFIIGDIEFEIIKLMHGNLPVLGFRIGNFAYCTDTNYISEESLSKLKGLDYLILDSLRFTPHPTHFTIEESIDIAKRIGAKQTYFTHIAHNIKHSVVDPTLPKNINLAFDGLEIM
ncbi:MBL fold metallo-hydrolase [Candidatus Kapabacteria bacterium]|nr:MBL fold metallo-hydrolase [Candidatus Kapabacteria bacterium]